MWSAGIVKKLLDKRNIAFYDPKLKKTLKGASIIVIRYKNGSYRESKPCRHCCEYLKTIGIKTVYYSNDYNQMVIERVSDIKTDHISLARRIIKNC